MALTPTIIASEGITLGLVREVTVGIKASEGGALALVNFPTASLRVSQAGTMGLANTNGEMQVSEAATLALVRGRYKNPVVNAFTFSLDSHDYYALRLGDDATIVLDLMTKQWVDWDSDQLSFWRVRAGINWLGGQGQADRYGSNVLVGDDLFGTLYFLDPKFGMDEAPDIVASDKPFTRVVMGQLPITGRAVAPCNVVYLSSDVGEPAYTGAAVTLYTSDDGGITYSAQNTIVADVGDYSQEFAWRSLGQISAPGRLFKIVDDGAFARIDSLNMNEDE